MKKKIMLTVGVLLAAGSGAVWYFREPVANEASQQAGAKAQKPLYVCPMHPQIRSDKPGKCPICGMDLVLSEEQHDHVDQAQGVQVIVAKTEEWENVASVQSEHQGHSSSDQDDQEPMDHSGHQMVMEKPSGHADFKLTMNKQQMIGVQIGKVERKPLFKTIHSPGRIAFDPELYTAQSEYLEALKQWDDIRNSPLKEVRENTKQMIESSKIRLKVLGLSDDQIRRLTKKGSQSEGLLVTGKGQVNWIYADVFEVDLPYIKKGLSAQITANFLQGKVLAGKVISVDQVINPETRTAKVRIQLLESHASIRPESYVNVSIFAPLGEQLSVPREALLDTGRETFVFINKGEGSFEPRKVSVFLETDQDIAIDSGVMEGENVVIGGNFMLDSESRLKAVIQGAGETSGGHQHH